MTRHLGVKFIIMATLAVWHAMTHNDTITLAVLPDVDCSVSLGKCISLLRILGNKNSLRRVQVGRITTPSTPLHDASIQQSLRSRLGAELLCSPTQDPVSPEMFYAAFYQDFDHLEHPSVVRRQKQASHS